MEWNSLKARLDVLHRTVLNLLRLTTVWSTNFLVCGDIPVRTTATCSTELKVFYIQTKFYFRRFSSAISLGNFW